jgi:hypothetical protein
MKEIIKINDFESKKIGETYPYTTRECVGFKKR